MTEINWDNVTIVWHDEPPSIENINQIVLEDCAKNLKNMKSISDIIFHNVFLKDDNVVNVWAHDEDENLHCEFIPLVDWSGDDDEE